MKRIMICGHVVSLTSAPSTFQSLMNSIFNPFLRKFVLVFFDDILIYNVKSWEEHVQHVESVLQLLEEQQIMQSLPSVPLGFKKWNIWVILYLMKVYK